MQADLENRAESSSAGRLVAHLRDHPEDALQRPEELAKSLGVEPQFVREVLDGLKPPSRTDAKPFRISMARPRRWLHEAAVWFDQFLVHPVRFVAWTLAVCLAIALGWR